MVGNKSRMARTFGVNLNHLRTRSGSMPLSSPRSASSYNGRLPRCRAWEQGPSLVDEPGTSSGVTAVVEALNSKIYYMSTDVDGSLYML